MMIDLENTGLMRLDRGAMQNWSDLDEAGAPAAPAVRDVVVSLVDAGDRVLVVGPTGIDVVTELADIAGHLSVLTRSIPDGSRYAHAVVNRTNVDVVCGDVLNLETPLGTYDIVLVLDDLARVPSLEDVTPSWRSVFDAVVACVAPGGRLALAVENELGLHRITSLRSRYTKNDNGAWDVVATYDASRPRTSEALDEVLRSTCLVAPRVAGAYPTWDEHTLLAWNLERASASAGRVLDALTLSSPALRRLGADPTRVTRAAVLAGRIRDLPAGWFVVAGRDVVADDAMTIVASVDGSVMTFADTPEGVLTDDGRTLTGPEHGELFGELALDACASGDAARFRALVQQWWRHTQEQAVGDELPGASADLRLDNLLLVDDVLVPVAAGRASSRLDVAAWTAIVDFVAVLRARGARHLWPAAMDDRTMAATIGAMAGLPLSVDLNALIGERATQLDLPAHDVAGLLAVIERLEEKNAALASRANWFESRLNMRERELRGRAKRQAAELALAARQQETLRKSAEDVRRSLSYRLGNAALGPLKEAKKRVMR